MADAPNPYALAAPPAFFSAALHTAVLPFAASQSTDMVLGGFLWLALGFGLLRGLRVVAYLAFLLGLFGGIYALSSALSLDGVASLIFWAMWAADWVVAAILFVALWRSHPRTA